MSNSSPQIARAQAKRQQKMQEGTIVSFTTLAHPPRSFGHGARRIGLILLDDGTQVTAQLLMKEPRIGLRVIPRMRLSRVTETALRVYDVAYEEKVMRPVEVPQAIDAEVSFPGYILALTGPSGVGKSTISRLLKHGFVDYTENVPILTTRSQKSGDEGEYVYVSIAEFEELRAKGQIIAATHIPSATEERWYGYRAADIEAIWAEKKIPIVITEMHLLQGLADHFGRRSILSFGLLPPGHSKRTMLSHLLHRLRSRGRDTEEHIKDRIKNAEKDLDFFRARRDLFDHLVVNEDLDTVIADFRKAVPAFAKA